MDLKLKHLDELEEPLRNAVLDMRTETLSSTTSERLLAAARDLAETEPVPLRTAKATSKSKKLFARAIAVAASVAVLLGWATWPRQTIAWEQVVAAVETQTWMVFGNQDEKTWYRSDPQAIACRASGPSGVGEVYAFFDLEKNTIDYFAEKAPYGFAREPGKVFRSAIRTDNRRGIDAAVRRYEAALQGRTSEMLLDSYDVASQEVSQVAKDGKKLLEFRFTLNPIHPHHPQQIVITVDPDTKLPVEKRIRVQSGSDNVLAITFPSSGPSSIFDLNIPQDIEVVDTRPNEASQEILVALRRGRTEMDSYVAVSTEGKEFVPRPQGTSEHLIWRSGTRWRIEQARIFDPKNPNPEPDSSDPVGWWHTFVEDADTAIEVIGDGQTECTYKRDRSTGDKPDPKNPSFLLIERYEETVRHHRDPSDPDTYHDDLLAEWIGYPKVAHDGQFEIESELTDGASDTVIFKVTHGGYVERLWLDAKRNYLAVRHEWIHKDNDQRSRAQEVLEAVQTPSGKWLPSVVRTYVPSKDGNEPSRYRNFFYRFEGEIDESKFVISDL